MLALNGNNASSALDKAIQEADGNGDDSIDPTYFTRSVLEQCKYVNPVASAQKPMLYRGSSIQRLCKQNPSYANAFAKTVYGKKSSQIPTLRETSSSINGGLLLPMDGNTTSAMDLMSNRRSRENHFDRRGKSVQHSMLLQATALDFSAITMDDDDKFRFSN